MRLWGWKENAAEQEQDRAELTARAKAGQALYGESELPEYIQGVAHRNSMWSQLKFGVLPWFNFVKCVLLGLSLLSLVLQAPLAVADFVPSRSHPFHGTDPAKYKEDA